MSYLEIVLFVLQRLLLFQEHLLRGRVLSEGYPRRVCSQLRLDLLQGYSLLMMGQMSSRVWVILPTSRHLSELSISTIKSWQPLKHKIPGNSAVMCNIC